VDFTSDAFAPTDPHADNIARPAGMPDRSRRRMNAPAAHEPALAQQGSACRSQTIKLSLGALGVVYGDIGTSPLYAIRESLLSHHHHSGGAVGTLPSAVPAEIALGVVSVATWALVLIIVVKYLTLALRADNHGEGGILAILALLTRRRSGDGDPHAPQSARRRAIIFPALMAGSLLLAEGMITPAISVLGAMEGLKEVSPQLDWLIVPVSVLILLALFMIQRLGTTRIARWFGPMMAVWFVSIAIMGLLGVLAHPRVLAGVNPWHGAALFLNHPHQAFMLMGSIVLVITGAEALYADMGHFGRIPIRWAWYTVVFPALLLNYYGQAGIVLDDPGALSNPFYALVPASLKYAMIAVATCAAIIASQAMISGGFSLAHQAVQLGYAPRLTVKHTSASMIGQVFVPSVNNLLMFACCGLVLAVGNSSGLASMYGLSVTGTMIITTLMLYMVAREQWRWSLPKAASLTLLFLLVEGAFFASSLTKLMHGGWVAAAVGVGSWLVMVVWFEGRAILSRSVDPVQLPMSLFLADVARQKVPRVPGVAVFMASRSGAVPPVLLHHLKHNRMLHERVVLLSVRTLPQPRVSPDQRFTHQTLDQGFEEVGMSFGFMEDPDVPAMLKAAAARGLFQVDPDTASYYLGHVSLRACKRGWMPRWAKGLFIFLYHNERSATEFFNLPVNRVVELGRQAEL
jgi:KUP system potassium uptake protein